MRKLIRKLDPVIMFFGLMMGITLFLTFGISVYSEQFMSPLSYDEYPTYNEWKLAQEAEFVGPQEKTLEQALEEYLAEQSSSEDSTGN